MYCGIDLGSSSLKCALFDESGARLGLGWAPVGLYHDASGAALADTAEWERALADALAQALAQSRRPAADIRALALSGNGPTLVACGADGRALGMAISWMDRRAAPQAERIAAKVGRKIDPAFYLAKALAELERRADAPPSLFFSGPEYLAHRLGADPVSYLPDDYYEPYIWDLGAADAMGLARGLFPPYVRPCSAIGGVSRAAAERFGLKPSTPIAAGYPDFLATLVGSASMKPGMVCDRSGSSEALNLCARAPFKDGRLFSLPHAAAGLWNLSGGVSTSGKALEWFSKLAGYSGLGGDSLYQDFQAASPGAGGALFLPYLAGERAPLWAPGLRGGFVGLGLTHGRRELARAAVEGIVFGLKLALGVMAEGDEAPALIRCTGGAARNDALCQLKADALGLAVELPETPEAETLGDACAAAVALGDYASVAEAAASMVRCRRRFEPGADAAVIYEDGYGRWRVALEYALAAAPSP